MDEALYGAEGFYTLGGGAGRKRDFITSPEVGPLFGAVLARALDTWWNELGCPSPFMVAECGAGPGTLCRDILRARPACASELRYILVDTAEPMRALHRTHRLPLVEPSELLGQVETNADGDHVVVLRQGPLVASLPALPDEPLHVILANELLDNLPFDIAMRADDQWDEVRVGIDDLDAFRPILVALDAKRAATVQALVGDVAVGSSVPLIHGSIAWIGAAYASLMDPGGRIVAIDYGAPMAELAQRRGAWLRTYLGHDRGPDPFANPGTNDITADVAIDFVGSQHRVSSISTQRAFLEAHGIQDLVDEARRTWHDRAATSDLAALLARSRVGEADALLDPGGLGGFVVLEWIR